MLELSVGDKLITRRLLVIVVIIFAINFPYVYLQELIGTSKMSFVLSWINANGEPSFPAWFSSTLLFIASAMAWLCSRIDAAGYPRQSRGWLLVSFGLLFMSIDEAIMIHEHLDKLTPVEQLGLRPKSFAASWIVVAYIIMTLLSFIMIPFLRNLPRKTVIRLVGAGAVFLTGSTVIEALSAKVSSIPSISYYYHSVLTFEESFEMIGVILLIRALMLHISESSQSKIKLSF